MGRVRRLAKLCAEQLPLDPLRSVVKEVLRFPHPWTSKHEYLFTPPFAFLTHGQGIQLVTLRNGRKIIVDTQEHVGLILMWTGDLDPALSELARRILRPGDRVMDVGANVGWFSMVAADLVGSEGRVDSFEPQPHLCTLFEASLLANDFHHVTLHRYGLSPQQKTTELFVSRSNSGLASLYEERVANPIIHKIELRTLEGMPSNFATEGFRLIKLDVEGHELAVLETIEPVLRRHPGAAILFESNLDPRPFSARETPRWLEARGYTVLGVEGSGARVRLNPRVSRSNSNDFLAWHKDTAMPESVRACLVGS